MNNLDPEAFVKEARTWLGVPFHHQGRNRKGIDCLGIIVKCMQSFGIEVKDKTDYPLTPNSVALIKELKKYGDQIPLKDIRPADILLFRISNNPQHLAIKTDLGMIHAYQSLTGKNRVDEVGLDEAWRKRLVMAFRIKWLL